MRRRLGSAVCLGDKIDTANDATSGRRRHYKMHARGQSKARQQNSKSVSALSGLRPYDLHSAARG